MSKTIITTLPATFAQKVREAARNGGAGRRELVALLKSGKINWANAGLVATLAREFQLSWYAGILNCDVSTAASDFALKPYNPLLRDPDDTRRTQVQNRAYRAAITAFSECATAAGMPPRRVASPKASKGARTPDTRSTKGEVAETGEPALASPAKAVFAMPKANKPEDATLQAVKFAEMLNLYTRRNARAMSGELKSLFARFEADVKRIAEGKTLDMSEAA